MVRPTIARRSQRKCAESCSVNSISHFGGGEVGSNKRELPAGRNRAFADSALLLLNPSKRYSRATLTGRHNRRQIRRNGFGLGKPLAGPPAWRRLSLSQ